MATLPKPATSGNRRATGRRWKRQKVESGDKRQGGALSKVAILAQGSAPGPSGTLQWTGTVRGPPAVGGVRHTIRSERRGNTINARAVGGAGNFLDARRPPPFGPCGRVGSCEMTLDFLLACRGQAGRTRGLLLVHVTQHVCHMTLCRRHQVAGACNRGHRHRVCGRGRRCISRYRYWWRHDPCARTDRTCDLCLPGG